MAKVSFSLQDAQGNIHSTKHYAGQWIVLYFYPRDDTPGCTIEACGFRDAFDSFRKRKIVVLGVSGDSADSHKKFAAKHKLPFPLLVDKDNTIAKKLGAFGEKKFMGRTYQGIHRKTFLIDPKGNLAHTFEKVKPLGHDKEVLDFILNQ